MLLSKLNLLRECASQIIEFYMFPTSNSSKNYFKTDEKCRTSFAYNKRTNEDSKNTLVFVNNIFRTIGQAPRCIAMPVNNRSSRCLFTFTEKFTKQM
jgi:hypothetical protein